VVASEQEQHTNDGQGAQDKAQFIPCVVRWANLCLLGHPYRLLTLLLWCQPLAFAVWRSPVIMDLFCSANQTFTPANGDCTDISNLDHAYEPWVGIWEIWLVIVDDTANIWFLYAYANDRPAQIMSALATIVGDTYRGQRYAYSGLVRLSCVASLGLIIGCLATLAFAVDQIIDILTNTKSKLKWRVLFQVGTLLLQSPVFIRAAYAIAIWTWLIWELHVAGQHCVKQVTEHAILNLDASKRILALLDYMETATDDWRVNHVFRVTTSAMLGILWVSWGGLATYRYIGALVWLLSLCFMWAWPAFASDRFWKKLHIKLARIAHATDCEQPALALQATALSTRLNILHGRYGINFAGVPVTMARAWLASTVLWSAVGLVTRELQSPSVPLTPFR
jgi:hypothetical protein